MKKKISVVCISIFAFVMVGFTTVQKDFFEIAKQIEIFTTLFKEVNMNYVDEVNTAELMNTAITAMMNDLDPYTQFYNEQDVQDARVRQSASFSSIGADLDVIEKEIIITDIEKEGPADLAGIKVGDIIVQIENIPLSGNPDELKNLLQGAPGSNLELQVLRQNKPIQTKLTRSNTKEKAVPYYQLLPNKVGYIVLSKFIATASRETEYAVKDLKSQGATSLILDLRNNPGGLLGEAVNVTNIFVPKDVQITYTQSVIEKYNANYVTKNRPVDIDIPLVVLINERSASASEIVSGSLQDLDRAVVVGNRSFGKGLVQRPKNLSYGTSAKITISRYYTPSGRCIQALQYKDGKAIRKEEASYNEFTTKNGRKVYDGGGITPDISLPSNKVEGIVEALLDQQLIFNFATDYYYSNKIGSIEDLVLTEKDFKNFVSFTEENDFVFENETEKLFQEMKLAASQDALDGVLNKELENLEKSLASAQKEALLQQKELILKLLSKEIIKRYFYQEGLYTNEIQQGEELQTAIQTLTNLPTYEGILKPSN